MDPMTEALYRDTARRLYHREGELEIDPDAEISASDCGCRLQLRTHGGAYVAAWVWVCEADLPEKWEGEES